MTYGVTSRPGYTSADLELPCASKTTHAPIGSISQSVLPWGEDYSPVTKPSTPQYCLLMTQEPLPALTHTVSHTVAMQAQLFVDLLCPSAAVQASFHA